MNYTQEKEKERRKGPRVGGTSTPVPPVAVPSPEMRAPKDIVLLTAEVAKKRVYRRPMGQFSAGFLAGVLIAIAAIATCSVAYQIGDSGLAKVATALLFPFGLGLVIFMGAELFTGNCLMPIGVLEKKISFQGMLVNWLWVFLGNLVGSLVVVFSYATTYMLESGGGKLAVYYMQIAATKCNLDWMDGFILGIWCNVLVCIAVLNATGARDPVGKALGGLMPVSLFVMAGFEHCVANMCYIPMGIMAAMNPTLGALAMDAGVNVSSLTVGQFITNNLIPVTVGNTVGGVLIGLLIWYSHQGKGGDFYDGTRSS